MGQEFVCKLDMGVLLPTLVYLPLFLRPLTQEKDIHLLLFSSS